MNRCDSGLVSDLRCDNDAGLCPVKVESELASLTSAEMVMVVAALMMLLLIVLPESRVRSVMAWGGSPRSHLPLPGPICLNCLLSHCNPPLRWETDWRQAAARTLPLPHRLSPSTLHPPKHGTPPDPNDRPTSYRYRDFCLCVYTCKLCPVFGLKFDWFLYDFLLFFSSCVKRCWIHYGNTTLHGPSKLL